MKDVSIPIPERIGPYKVLRPLAQGGMAAVFAVEHPSTREHLALKLLTHRGLAMPRFAREYRALTRLDHPNIVKVYEFGVHEGSPYLTMELLDGVPVQAYAKSITRPGRTRRTREVLRCIALVADALHYLHQRGIVHRDLKSANVLVLADRRVKLLDFGTARIVTNSGALTRQGEFVGTFAYASPEQITGGEVDARSDLYSLGALLYRLCTGKRVFEADTPHELARKHVEKPPRPPRELVPALPESVEQLILRLLEKEPEKRPPSAQWVAEAIRGRKSARADSAGISLASPRLAGRDAELQAISARLMKPKPGRLVLVVGPPGSGRARLVRAAMAEVRGQSWRVFDASFTGLAGAGALAELTLRVWRSLPQLDRDALDEERGWLEASNRPAITSSQRAAVNNAVTTVLTRRVERDEAPLVLALHDLDRASPLALDVLAHARLALKDADVPVAFVCSSSSAADRPGATIRRRLPEAWRVQLRPLGVNEVGDMVRGMLGGARLPPELARKLHEVTGGQPGYVEEVVRAMVQAGLVEAYQSGSTVTWVDRSAGRIAIPGSAREAITLRLDALEKDAVRLIEALAVAGGQATVAVLAFAVDEPEEDVLKVLDGLAQAHTLTTTEENGEEHFNFALGMTRDLVLERLRPSRRNVLRRRLAEKVADQPASAQKTILLAAAGRADEAVRDALIWAEPQIERNRAIEVLPVLEKVERTIPQATDTSKVDKARFYLAFGRALMLASPADDRIDEIYRRASTLTADARVRGQVELYWSRALVSRGDLTQGREHINRAYEALTAVDDPALKSRVAGDLGKLNWLKGSYVEAERWFDESLTAARNDGGEREVATALVSRGVAYLGAGALRKAERHLREAARLFESSGDRSGYWHAWCNLAELMRLGGRFSEPLRVLIPELGAAHEAGDIERFAQMSLNVAEIEIELFRLGRARERLADLRAIMDESRHLHLRCNLAVAAARIALASNQPGLARASLEPMLEESESAGVRVNGPLMRALLAEAHAMEGDEATAVSLFDDAVGQLRKERNVPTMGMVCVARARAMQGKEDPDQAFRPVLRWMELEPAARVRMEYLIATVRNAVQVGDRERAVAFLLATRELLQDIKRGLDPDDKDTLRVHPWSAFIRRGLDRAGTPPRPRT